MRDNKYTDYTDFLKDRKFIQWQLLPDDRLDEYWHAFIEKNPDLTAELSYAKEYLKTSVLNKPSMTENERLSLLKKIQSSTQVVRKKRKLRRYLQYASAACAVIAIIVGLLYFSREESSSFEHNKDLISGNQLNNENIQLITAEKTISYKENIDVAITTEGTVKVIQSGREESIETEAGFLNKLIVPYGKRSKIELADGSKVWLNSGSVVEFPSTFSKQSREIYLSGEMYIEVAPEKNRSFYVHTPDFLVKVYGTKFNVSTYTDTPSSVVLVEGSVALQASKKHPEQRLHPNELAIFDPQSNTFDKRLVDINSFISWKDGYLIFDKTPIPEVLKQIERYYNLSFNFGQDIQLQKRTCTGKIYLSDNLDNVMATIALLTSTKYTRTEHQIYITNENN
ncbi:MAG TPA: iron dicitrate transport regulator FecR [Porphyromonadaceae bacterium]|jgi:hypothetical protein|nr:iron dicitrate transport regulator FecR [Porphyromonadaceae bacterium]HBK32705.1 iron dicitrate transport regulator FecR [Porphyromonadaceae bacterium]HBL33806.1 iron dicitrate transport regulator FecR [Porphyromonadaceae bacterium]HBX20027.1 iron dicitrate transport regulator FecR [Porphyromonadaceae bacterium]HBX44864.1 iron dicitrate transport regulator FecR [Porphyromonadaceae bacterium]